MPVVVACGSKDDAADSADGTGPGGTGTGTGTGAPTGGTTGTGGCTSWVGTYDLTGSEFTIDAFVDFTIVVQEPYEDDLNTGPGSLVVRFADAGGAAGPGGVLMASYQMTHDFVTGVPGLAEVHTDVENTATTECGVASGQLAAGSTVQWSPSEIADYCQNGQISCAGPGCGTFGSPPEDEPQIFDDACSTLPLTDFVFASDLLSFTMARVVVSETTDVTTSHTLIGTAPSLVEDPATPACLCPTPE